MKVPFKLVAHTADLELEVYGNTRSELFSNTLVAMFQSIKPDAPGCSYVNELLVCEKLSCEHEIIVVAQNIELLLVDFLSQALYLSDVHNQAYLAAEIHELSDTLVKATLRGMQVTGFRNEIKAVTYHNLCIEQKNGRWLARIVFDI